MAECWSCGAERARAAVCGTCAKLQPPDKSATLFEILALPPKMGLTRDEVEKAFRDASSQFHPDRYGDASSVERKLALEHTVKINEAYRALRVSQSRAEYLMKLASGVDVASEDARTQDPELLMEMMERQEQVDGETGEDALEAILKGVKSEQRRLLDRVAGYFDAREGDQSAALSMLDRLRYLKRLSERVEHKLEDV